MYYLKEGPEQTQDTLERLQAMDGWMNGELYKCKYIITRLQSCTPTQIPSSEEDTCEIFLLVFKYEQHNSKECLN